MGSSSNEAIENAVEIIERFGGIRPMAKKMDVAVTTVQGWKKRDVIPAGRRADVIKSAQEHDIELADLLGEVANQNEGKSPAEIAEAVSEPAVSSVEPASIVPVSGSDKSEKKQADAVAPTSVPKAAASEKVSDKALEETEKRAVTKSVWISFILFLLAVAAIAALLWPQHKDEQRLRALEENLNQIKSDVNEVKGQQSFFGTMIPENLSEQLSSLQEQAGQAREQIDMALTKAQEVSQDVLSNNAGTIEQRYIKLSGHVSEMVASPVLASFMSRVQSMDSVEQGQEQFDIAMKELSAAISQASVAGAEIEGKKKAFDFSELVKNSAEQSPEVAKTFEGVPAQELKAAALLLGLSQFRSSLNRDNKAFAADLNVLMGIIGDQDPELRAAVERLAPQAEKGVLTPSGLSNEFKSIAGDAVMASLQGEDVSLQERASAKLNEVLQIEKDGELITGTETQNKIAKAESLLEAGDIESAVSTIETLDGEALAVLSPWVEKAKATLMAQDVEEQLSRVLSSGAIKEITSGLGLVGGTLLYDEEAGINVLVPSSLPNVSPSTAPVSR
ncbi:MAG: hypothetical protein CMH26_06690 [Micavibrio sp.]|nr:hypothetical protein [Micavibrio sp.]